MQGSQTLELKVFIVPKDKPAGPLTPSEPIVITAQTTDGFVAEAKRLLVEKGYTKIRAISFTASGMVAYIEDAR